MQLSSQLIYWGSYLLLPVFAGLLVMAWQGPLWRRLVAIALLIPAGLSIYARFIEPTRLIRVVSDAEICGRGLPGTLKIAVLSDLHMGVYGHSPSIGRIVSAINRSTPDVTLMTGDFTYHLSKDKMLTTFEAFEHLNSPAYAILGPQDRAAGQEYASVLTKALEYTGIIVLTDEAELFHSKGKMVKIKGFANADPSDSHHVDFLSVHFVEEMPVIALAHDPSIVHASDIGHYDLMVAGGTHGGQVWIPGLTCKWSKACDTLRYGLATTPTGTVFVSAGTGMTDVPVRFNMLPRVDLIRLRINRCATESIEPSINVFPHLPK